MREDLERSGADWVISLYDAWVYTEQRQDPFEGLPRVASWIPVDHYPTPLSLYEWLTHGHVAIAMSRFGQDCLTLLSAAWQAEYERQLRDAKGDRRKVAVTPGFPVRYAPHALEDVFRPVESDFRQQIGVPADAYLVGIVAANYGSFVYDRKGITDMAAALGYFMESHPDAYVYVHTIAEGAQMLKLPSVFAFSGVPDERIRWADQHALKKHAFTDEQMAQAYSAFDVLLATSRGEGFGIPVIEAQACGTPVIVSNWTAQPELVGEPWNQREWGLLRYPNGWAVPVLRDYDPRHGADFAKPQLGVVVKALEEAYADRGNPERRDAALAKAEQYRADPVFATYWRPILDEMDAATRVVPMNREQRRTAMRKRAKIAVAR